MSEGPLHARLWAYQAERFPVFAHGVLALAFAIASSLFATGLSGARPGVLEIGLGFALAFTQFVMLRVADEHKDFADDVAHRPYRPVPRGLVSLAELRGVGATAALAQAVIIFWLWRNAAAPWALSLWAGVQLWFALMSLEFGARELLRRAPLVTLFSHMAILPGIAWLAAAPSLALAGAPASTSRPLAFALAGIGVFALGCVLELARKIRAPADEEEGVETYSTLYGAKIALIFLFATVGDALIFAVAPAALVLPISHWAPIAAVLIAAIAFLGLSARPLLSAEPEAGAGAKLEQAAAVFALAWLAVMGGVGWLAGAPV